jgi:hypothetical protein
VLARHALALLGDGVAIKRRVWSGQVGVLMPFLEDRRQELLRHLDGQFRLPWQTTFKEITDALDLELAHIQHQVLAFRLRVPPALQEVLPTLTKMRNQLAHLEVVAVATLDDAALLKVEHGVPAPYVPPPKSPVRLQTGLTTADRV